MNTDRKELLYTTLQETGIALSLFDLSDRAGLEVDEAQMALHALSAEGRVVLTKRENMPCPKSSDSAPRRPRRCAMARPRPIRWTEAIHSGFIRAENCAACPTT